MNTLCGAHGIMEVQRGDTASTGSALPAWHCLPPIHNLQKIFMLRRMVEVQSGRGGVDQNYN